MSIINLRIPLAAAVILCAVGAPALSTSVTVRPGDSLSVVAERAGVSQEALAATNGIRNPALIRIGQRLRVPGTKPVVSTAPTSARGTTTHLVKAGETFTSIAARYNCSATILAKANGYDDPRKLIAGTRIVVPTMSDGTRVTTPTSVVKTGLVALPAPVKLTVNRPSGSSTSRRTYRVRSGDSLSAIASRYGISTARLGQANGISDPTRLVVGRVLRVPTITSARKRVSTPKVAIGQRRVAAGETLSQIAEEQETTVARLMALNRLADVNAVVIGQVLRVPVVDESTTAATKTPATPSTLAANGKTAARSYRVKPGDSLGSIAMRASTGVGAIMRLNNLQNPNQIIAGTVLRLPEVTAPATTASVRALIDREAAARGVDPALARAVAWQESGFAQSMVSKVGAIGVMQVLPATSDWAAKYIVGRPLDPSKVEDNVVAGVAYLQWLVKNAPDRRSAIAGYYQGLASVQSRGMLAETKQYVDNVEALTGRV